MNIYRLRYSFLFPRQHPKEYISIYLHVSVCFLHQPFLHFKIIHISTLEFELTPITHGHVRFNVDIESKSICINM